MTKHAVFVTDAREIPYILQHATYLAQDGRPGPVWIDIPGDIQVAPMPDQYIQFTPPIKQPVEFDSAPLKNYLLESERPIVLAGQGIRQANCVSEFINFVETYQLPFVSTYGARDFIQDTHELNLGAIGIKGSRYGNFAMQNADLLLVLGSSLNSSVIGYNPAQFSIGSKKVVVDCDVNELGKDILKVDQKYNIELADFFKGML
jgi:acetolactate synthase-1/2/3 large subunit